MKILKLNKTVENIVTKLSKQQDLNVKLNIHDPNKQITIILQLNFQKIKDIEVRIKSNIERKIVEVRHLYILKGGDKFCLEDQKWWEMENRLSLYVYKNRDSKIFYKNFDDFLNKSREYLKKANQVFIGGKRVAA